MSRGHGPLAGAAQRVRAALAPAVDAAAAEGMPRLDLRGQLIRPLAALAAAERTWDGEPPAELWRAALAVQMAHEASLVHDDIVDAAASRRGEPTLSAARGVGAALVHGDHLLTAAYRVAAETGSPAFAVLFARAVERTVAWEIVQGRSAGEVLGLERYREIATGKAGELLGCALASAPTLAGSPAAPRIMELGRRMGLLYQMVDDLLDYCPAASTGKPPLADYRQRRWTWPLRELPDAGFGHDPGEVVAELSRPAEGGSALRRCLARLEAEAGELRAALTGELGPSPILEALLDDWLARSREGVRLQEETERPGAPPRGPSGALRSRVPAEGEVGGFLGRHSRSFLFASRLFPRAERERVERVYAFCRITDDLVDAPGPGGTSAAEAMLSEWEGLAREAYEGRSSGLPLLDRVMGEAASAAVPFDYAAELVEGMRMDLRGERYPSLDALRVYTHRVAGVVGLWLSGLFGVRDPWALQRAAAMGHAMQLTNILRDVGEDARGGRVYLPLDALARHGLSPADVAGLAAGRRPLPPGYAALVEELLQEAEGAYREAFAAIPCLPQGVRRPVAVAAFVYRGIHAQIRAAGYDNLSRRARTSAGAKVVLGARALLELSRTPELPASGGKLAWEP